MKSFETLQKSELPELRQMQFRRSKYEKDVTLVIYAFPPAGREREFFDGIEWSVLHSWKILGAMNTSLVVSHEFSEAVDFAKRHDEVKIHVAPGLIPGKIETMSIDCIANLHSYFSTPYCLVIQNDGFPIQDTLDRFLWKYDYMGASAVRDPRRRLMRLLRLETLNGGFSLRSHKICKNASRQWKWFWRFLFSNKQNRFVAEDVFYTTTARLNPFYAMSHRFPPEKESCAFAYDDLGGLASPPKEKPFGLHGKSTVSARYWGF